MVTPPLNTCCLTERGRGGVLYGSWSESVQTSSQAKGCGAGSELRGSSGKSSSAVLLERTLVDQCAATRHVFFITFQVIMIQPLCILSCIWSMEQVFWPDDCLVGCLLKIIFLFLPLNHYMLPGKCFKLLQNFWLWTIWDGFVLLAFNPPTVLAQCSRCALQMSWSESVEVGAWGDWKGGCPIRQWVPKTTEKNPHKSTQDWALGKKLVI